jgi:serine protein kinase
MSDHAGRAEEVAMPSNIGHEEQDKQQRFVDSLTGYTQAQQALKWEGPLSQFLREIFSRDPKKLARTSHQYIWDMVKWHGFESSDEGDNVTRYQLFAKDLYGVDEPLERFANYFKAASEGSEVGRRLLLLLGPPSGGKSSLVTLLKRGLETYSHSDEGALYAVKDSPVHENPLLLIPPAKRAEFQDAYGVEIEGAMTPHLHTLVELEYHGDFMSVPVERIFISEAARKGIGTYAPHDPNTADIADLVGSVDLSKVAHFGDEGDPRAWSWSGAVYSANRGLLEMIEILKVKREFLYLLLTLTQEKNVKVSRFPLIHLDESIIAHTNLAEFRRFLKEKENEALLDRMVIVQVPYTLRYHDEARIYRKLTSATPAFREVHLDPHALNVAAVFAVLTRLAASERENLDLAKKARLYAGEEVEGIAGAEVERIRRESPEEGIEGVSPRFVVNALANAISRSDARSLTAMEVLLALKDGIDSDARMDQKRKKEWKDFLVTVRKEFYNQWVKQDVQKALFVSFQDEAQRLLDKYLDEVEAVLDNRKITDPITAEERDPDERFLRAVEEKIRVSDSGKQSFRQEVVRKAMGAYKRGEKFTLASHARLREAVEQYLFEERRDVLRLVTSESRPDEEAQKKISAVEYRLVADYGYDVHSAREALNYVTTLLAQE